MRQPGSDAPLPIWLALAAAIAGVLAMTAGAPVARDWGLRAILLVSETLLLVPALLALGAFGRDLPGGLGLANLPARAAAAALAAGAASWVASLGLFELQYTVWPPPEGYLELFRQIHAALRPTGPLDALVSVAAIALVPAACEELVFRGVVLPALRTRLGAAGAVVGAATAFAMIHLDVAPGGVSVYRVPFAFAVGLALGALRVAAGSVVAPLLAHALLNTITFAATPLADAPGAELPAPEPLQGALMLVLGGAAAVAAIRAARVDRLTDRV